MAIKIMFIMICPAVHSRVSKGSMAGSVGTVGWAVILYHHVFIIVLNRCVNRCGGIKPRES